MKLATDASLAASLSPVPSTTACKICGAAAPLHGVVDFNKSCESSNGVHFPLSGVQVWYHRCTECRFLFSEQFDHWTPAMFRRHIYESYPLVDPEMDGTRAKREAIPLLALAGQVKASRVLDYGGGEGTLTRIMTGNGYEATSWDPMRDGTLSPPPASFDIVTAYEVFEHTPTPSRTCQEALSFARPGGLFLFSTLISDELRTQACDHWYISPRNGHISIHTTHSLRRLFAQLGWRVRHHGSSHHMAFAESAPGQDDTPDRLINSAPRATRSTSPD